MRGGGKREDDWSADSEGLFQAARFDHEASAADKARVQEAIALRLSQRAVETASVGQGAAGLGRRANQLIRSSSVVRLVLGAGCIAVVSTLSLLAIERSKQQPRPVDSAVVASTLNGTTGAPAAETSRFVAQGTAHLEARSATPATSARSEDALLPRATAVRLQSKTEPRARNRTRSAALSAGTRAADGRRAPSETPAPVEAEVAMVPDTAPISEPASRPMAAPSTPVVAPPSEMPEGSARASDARAELTLVERMQAALRAHESSLALALCNEHERRWPQGTFVEEREGIRALVACSTRAKNADVRARVFLAAHPQTTLAHRVAVACALQLAPTTSTDLGTREN